MEEQGVLAGHIPVETDFTHLRNRDNSKRYFKTKGHAFFTCENSHNSMGN